MSTLEDFQNLQENVERLKQDVSRAEGSLDRVIEELKETFDCDNLEDAKELLGTLQEECAELKKSFEKSLAKFQQKWDEKILEEEE